MASVRGVDAAAARAWIASEAEAIATRAERELAALVGVSSPSGDAEGAEEAIAVACSLLPATAEAERPACSTAGCAPDLLVRMEGTGNGRLLLLGHLDTVVPHSEHRRLEAGLGGDRLYGAGTVDMKGGDVLALGVMRALDGRREWFEEVALLLVNDEEWRAAPFVHGPAFSHFDACFCFEAGERNRDGEDACVVRRKAAAGLAVLAQGRAAHSGANPEEGRNALLALSRAAIELTALNDPAGEARLTVVPTVLRAGNALNVVPGEGELRFDLRADSTEALDAVFAAVPDEIDDVELTVVPLRRWPGMEMAERAAPLLDRAGDLLGRPVRAVSRGGASDASHLAEHVPLAVDGLGPIGAGAHAADEHVLRSSFKPRAEVALALVAAQLGTG